MKPCNLIEFRDDELMENFIDDLLNGDIAYETENIFKYGVPIQYQGISLASNRKVEFVSYIKEDVLQNLVNCRCYLLR